MVEIKAENRAELGKKSAKATRYQNMVPAILYGKNRDSMYLIVESKNLHAEYLKGGLFSKIITLKTSDNKSFKVILKDVQFDNVTDCILHADFMYADGKEPMKGKILLQYTNKEISVGIKRGGYLHVVRHYLDVMCEPNQIAPLEVSVEHLAAGQKILVKDLKLPKGVVPVLAQNFVLASLVGKSGGGAAKTASSTEE